MTEQVTRPAPLNVDMLMMTPAFMTDRYAVYDLIRDHGRVQYVQGFMPRWLISGHEAMREMLLKSDKFSSDRRLWDGWQDLDQDEAGSLMIAMDPPDHTRVRTPFQQALTPRGVLRFRPLTERVVDELLDEAADRGEIDLMVDFAHPLPLRVLTGMLGVPDDEIHLFKEYTELVLAALDVTTHTFRTQSDEVKRARQAVEDSMQRLIDDRRLNPRDDLVSTMVAAEDAADRLSAQELIDVCVGLIVAGNEPATYMIGNAISALFAHSDQLARAQSEPELLSSTGLEELLRYDAPVHLGGRVVKEDVELAGQSLKRGQLVAWNIGAANRDPEEFTDPHRLDLTRHPNRHLTFGHGIHRCVGSPMARLMLTVALPAIVSRFPALRPGDSGAPVRHTNPHVHAFESLPVAVN
jgi:cytochrome P450